MKKTVALFLVLVVSLMCFSTSILADDQTRKSKLTPELSEAMMNADLDELFQVYVILEDVDHDKVMKRFQEEAPDEYYQYYLASETNEENVDGELLQRGIGIKRSIYAEEYYTRNKAFADSISKGEDQLFVSKYSPMLIAELTKGEVLDIERNDKIEYIDLFINSPAIDYLADANLETEANWVRDIANNGNGYKGRDIKIGQIETREPDIVEDLNYVDITFYTQENNMSPFTNSPHATHVAQIMVGASNGIAPLAKLFCAAYNNKAEYYERVEWLITKEVNVINQSAGFANNGVYIEEEGKYDITAKWIDHIAVTHDVHYVIAAGNKTDNSTYHLANVGMAYNAITVGGYNDANNASGFSNFTLYGPSKYKESSTTPRAEKPNLVALAQNVYVGDTNYSGTSFAAPQVAAVIAQLCEYDNDLLTKQTAMGAMLAASSKRKITSTTPGSVGGVFSSTASVSGSGKQISNKEGAGMLNAKAAYTIAKKSNYSKHTIQSTSFPFSETVYINSQENSIIRIAIFWLKRNSLSGTHGVENHTYNYSPNLTNLNLYVYAPNGDLVGCSKTEYANFEIVQFVPTQTGNYTIKITRVAGSSGSSKEYVGIALW
ncbi:MAG: S8/S53 family peptidase [Clostridia bacterium]|nr:S8/S53 family peptidase [Clostridia bacterium]